jgi:AraC-like DNA-binding protein
MARVTHDLAGSGHGGDWARYWRHAELPLEAMHAHFVRHTYHRHSHDTYSFGVTETGAQAFTCRGASHVSSAGMVMAFNPDDPHNGHAATERGFTYKMVHIGPELVADVMADMDGRPTSRPLFADPVLNAPELAARVRDLHAALCGRASGLEQEERLAAAITALVCRAATASSSSRRRATPSAIRVARDVRAYLHDSVNDNSAVQVTSSELANAAGSSRFAAYRAFRAAFGLSPSEYQRQLRLRAARRLLARGLPAASVAADVGFADQAHLTRWFSRYYGVTPAAFQRAG